MKLVKLDDDVWVNPDHVVSVEREDRGTSVCTVNCASHFLDLDVYEVLDRLDRPDDWGAER